MNNHALYIQDLQSMLLPDKQTTTVIERFLGCIAINILNALSCWIDNRERQMHRKCIGMTTSFVFQDKIKVRWCLYRVNVS